MYVGVFVYMCVYMYVFTYLFIYVRTVLKAGTDSNRNAHPGGRRACNSRHVGPNLYEEVFIMEALSRKLDVASDNDSTHSTFPYFRNITIKLL
jgi:hypothetical protein